MKKNMNDSLNTIDLNFKNKKYSQDNILNDKY